MASRDSRIEGDMDEFFVRSCTLSPPTSSKKLGSDKLWQGHYCCVPLCRHSSAENALRVRFGLPRLSFHSFPSIVKDKARAQQWISKIRRDPGPDFVINTNTKVCSEHFTADDYSGKDPEAARRVLKKTAVPSLFPWNSDKGFQRATRNSNKTDSAQLSETSQQHCMELVSAEGMNETQDIGVEEVEFSGSDLIEFLQGKLEEMSLQLEELQTKHEKSLFRLENIKGDNYQINLYTSFPDYDTLLHFYRTILESDAKVMRQWRSGESKDSYAEEKTGRSHKLPLLEQLFLTLVRLRLGLLEFDLANRFGISQSSVSRITATWLNLLFHSLKTLERYPPWHIVKKYMPESFKEQYPNTRLILDATEFGIERPSSLVSQAATFSAYKNKNTVKVLIGIIPSGAIVFVSPTYEGSISDKKLVERSNLLDLLEVGDEIMADKGFDIQDLLAPLGVKLNIPPFLNSGTQFSSDNVLRTKKNCQVENSC